MEIRCLGCMRLKQEQPICEHCGYDEQTQNNSHQLPVGTVVGQQYILGRVLGQGGFGITYLGWDQIMNVPVAVKEYFPSGYAGRDTLRTLDVTSYDNQNTQSFEMNKKRFLREAESLAKLWEVPQIVKILRHFEENGTAYIAMEYVEGMDLRRYLKKLGRPMTMEETMDLLGPIIKALSRVHGANLVHRDISPDNIMVLPNGTTKLLDFGAARYVENADAEKDRNTSTQAILKHGFAPPEQYRSHGALGPWTDIYAICATIYYCLTGKVPPEAMERTIDAKPILWDKVPGLSQKQKSALKIGMSLQAKDRFRSAEALWEQLHTVSVKTEPSRTPNREKTSKSKALLLAGVAAVLAAVCIGAMGFHASRKQPAYAAAETSEAHSSVRFTYSENETGWTVTGFEGELPQDVVIPNEYQGKPVTSIGEHLFYSCDNLNSITIPDSTLSIGDFAFSLCSNITSFQIPEGVKHIGAHVFWGCTNLSAIELPQGLLTIGDDAFASCSSLTAVTIPGSVTSIENSAFSYCTALTEVTIEEGVILLGEYAFSGCTSLKSISLPGNMNDLGYASFRDCTALTDIVIPDGIQYIDQNLFLNCTSLTNVTLSDTVYCINANAFENCSSLVSITIPGGVRTIRQYAFHNCSALSEITFSEGLTEIEKFAFSGCSSLRGISLPKSLTTIGDYAFRDNKNLRFVGIPRKTEYGRYAFPDDIVKTFY